MLCSNIHPIKQTATICEYMVIVQQGGRVNR